MARPPQNSATNLRNGVAPSMATLCAFLSGCVGDHFFRATGSVVSCATSAPVAGAGISITIDQGAAPGPYSSTPSTDGQGNFDVRVADYSDAWVTLKF